MLLISSHYTIQKTLFCYYFPISLIQQVSELQASLHTAQERISMLEHSSAAMAKDLLHKADIIKHYCMAGGKSG